MMRAVMKNPLVSLRAALTCVAFVVFTATSPSFAQDGPFRIPVRAKIGLFQSTDGGSLGYVAEADILMPIIGIGGAYGTVGYGSFTQDGKRLTFIPVTANYVFALPNPVSNTTGNVYFGAGVGPYFLRAGGRSRTVPGGFGMVGYRFPDEKTFVELKYHVAGSVSGLSPNGFGLMLGRSF